MQAEIGDEYGLNDQSNARAARILGRCHLALGQGGLSAAALDSAVQLGRERKLLLSEALSIRARAWGSADAPSEAGAARGGLVWTEQTGKERLREVMGRMQGDQQLLEKLLLAPQYE